MSKTCSVEGCNGKHLAKGYCDKHYRQIRKYGHILERTIYDKNNVIEYEDYAEVVLYDNKGEEVARTMIDLEYVDLVKKYKWHLNSNGYATGNKAGLLHRLIMNPPKDMVIDHINHNKLDNRKSNLRICTHQENDWNKGPISTNTSGITGVIKTQWGTWQSRIEVNGKKICLGSFPTLEEATEARRQAELEYYGEFAPNNKE